MNREQSGVRKIRNKVTEKTAMLYDGTPESHYAIAKWAHDGLPPEANCIVYPDIYMLRIRTLEGDHTASPGDWVIRGLKGEFYPCKPDVFSRSYEFVDSLSVPDTAAQTFAKLRKLMGLSETHYDTPEKIADAAITRIVHLQSESLPDTGTLPAEGLTRD